MVEGFAGYSLPDDLLSGTGLRIAYSIVESIPIVGTYLARSCSVGSSLGPTSSHGCSRSTSCWCRASCCR